MAITPIYGQDIDDACLDRLQDVVGEDATIDPVLMAKNAILNRRFPYHDFPKGADAVTYVEERYRDLQFRIALDLYNKAGAEGQTAHAENGISRTYESSWISEQLLSEVTPLARI